MEIESKKRRKNKLLEGTGIFREKNVKMKWEIQNL